MYKLFVRQSLEFAVPLWSSVLSQQNKTKIERIQAQVTDLILGPNQLSYTERLRELQLCEELLYEDDKGRQIQISFPSKENENQK